MWINFSISENEMERIRNDVRSGQLKLPEGGKFVVEIEMVDGNLFPYNGEITFADPSYNPQTGTFLLRATVDNPEGVLRPNQYVRVRLTGAIRPNAILVPQRAVQQGAQGPLRLGRQQGQTRPSCGRSSSATGMATAGSSREGLADGDQVVVDGGVRLCRRRGRSRRRRTRRRAARPAPKTAAPPRLSRRDAFRRARLLSDRDRRRSTPDAQRAVRVAAAAYVGIGTQIDITGYADRTGNARGQRRAREEARASPCATSWSQLGVEPQAHRARSRRSDVTGSGSDDQARRVDVSVKQ